MVGGGGAARQGQFRETQECTRIDRFGCKLRPNGIERLEPIKENGILRSGEGRGSGSGRDDGEC